MKGIGEMIKPMVKGPCIMRMEMFTKGNGKMIRLTDGASTRMIMVQLMKEIGKKINRTDEVLKPGQTVLSMLASIETGRNMERAYFILQIKVCTRVSLKKTKFQDKEYTHGTMERNTRGLGRTTKWTGEEFLPGQMGSDTKVNL